MISNKSVIKLQTVKKIRNIDKHNLDKLLKLKQIDFNCSWVIQYRNNSRFL